MRRCLLDDLVAAARCLGRAHPSERDALARRLIAEAHAAHHYHRRFGRPHPRWGNGSLMTRALADSLAPEAPLCLASLATVASLVHHFRTANALRRVGLSEHPHLCYHDKHDIPNGRKNHGGNQGKDHGS